ncbi:TPA: hypothetical protein L3F84_004820 [Enterobacter cloacae]|uniref:hypothetical protein n=1 Tax=Enterobacter cloacae TaxID=550 RepID=UPI000BDC3214|nr:hypothetical protein [Enterobacter cloacae]PCM68966.1 hypothetical protein CP904_26565 [Enterobacter cloacae]HBN5546544.1 hypothetical protein [Enterobacter cloacae]
MSNIDKQAQYESKFSRLWDRYDEASHGNAEQMRDILEVTLDALESAERQILRLEKLAEAESVCADKAAASGIEWMKRCLAAEKRIAEMEAREVKLPNPHAHLIWIQAGHAPDDYWDDVAVSRSERDKCCDGSDRYPVYALWEIKEALSAIGINIAAAGKGEAS